MRVHAQGRGVVELRQTDFVASGGEGTLYARDGVAYKVWTDPSRVPSRDRLVALKAVPRATLPRELLTDEDGRLVGFTMDHLADHVPLARLCTRSYRERHGVGPERAAALVADLAELVARVHRAGAVVVDLSELNVLVDADHREATLVDCASWQLPGHPATAVADHVRDRRAPAGHFDEGTDWFSLAVIAFSVLVGIHPYRGAHALDLDARVRAGVTAWHPEVKVPRAAVWPRDAVPDRWRRWLGAVLERHERVPPPLGPIGAFSWAPTVLSAPVGAVRRERLLLADAPLRLAASHLGLVVAATDAGLYVDGRPAAALPGVEALAFGPRWGTPIAAARRDGHLALWCARTGDAIPVQLRGDALTTAGGRLIVKARDLLVEVTLIELRGASAARVVATPRTLAQVLPHATRLFDGCAVQDVHGATWLSVFPGLGAHRALRVPELDGARVLDARAGDGAALIRVAGDPSAWLVRWDEHGHTDVRALDGDEAALDLCVPSTGVAVLRREGGLELLRARPGDARARLVRDPVLDAPLRLVALGDRLGAIAGPELVSLSLSSSGATSSTCRSC